MKIALLTHSVNPRGGVVHVLELGAALYARGHDVMLFAPAAPGQGFFRATPCRVALARVTQQRESFAANVRVRIDTMREHLRGVLASESFDVLHAHDGIGGNALADLVAEGLVDGYVRTVHHLDDFGDADVQAWEERSIREAAQVLACSAHGRAQVRERLGIDALQVANGVDLARFGPLCDGGEGELAARIGLAGHPRVLCVGGIEARKNSLRLLQAFVMLRHRWHDAQLVIAGGASLLPHDEEVRAWQAEAERAGLAIGPGLPIVVTGALADADLPRLYRSAGVLAMPSLLEGFGLAAIEALACGTPAVVSRRPPFTEHFADEVHWADPLSAESIAFALAEAIDAGRRHDPPDVCRRFDWPASAARHESLYRLPNRRLGEPRPCPQCTTS